MHDRVTIKDIAEAAGVSASTVSRILNRKGKYTQETIDQVWNAVQELKYSPNFAAKSLRSKKNPLVGIVAPYIDDGYFSMLTNAIARELLNHSFAPMICPTYNDGEIEASYCRLLESLNASGIIYIFKDTQVHPSCQDIPTIFIGSAPENCDIGVKILFDIIGGARAAMETLIDTGCRRIVYMESYRQRDHRTGRFLGYQQALWENDIAFDDNLIVTVGERGFSTATEAMEHLLGQGIAFDGIFCNKMSASIEVIDYLKKHEISVPEDVKLVSFENGKAAEWSVPSISAIDMDYMQTSQSAVETLRSMIEDTDIVKKTIRIPAALFKRESSA